MMILLDSDIMIDLLREHPPAVRWLEIFTRFHLSHHVGLLDALIGQTAVALNVPLHTFNRKHYAAIPNLLMIEPYSRT